MIFIPYNTTELAYTVKIKSSDEMPITQSINRNYGAFAFEISQRGKCKILVGLSRKLAPFDMLRRQPAQTKKYVDGWSNPHF